MPGSFSAVHGAFGASAAAAGHPDHGGRKLRIGLFADSPLQPAWAVEALVEVAALDFAEIVVIGEGGAQRPAPPWPWRAYGRVDTWLFGRRPDPSRRVDLRTCVPQLRPLALPAGGCGQAAETAWRAELARLRLDVAFALGDVDDGLLEGMAKYGVWRYCFGEERGALESLAGFREVCDGIPVTASGLRIRRGPREDRLAYQSWSRTFPYSVARNRGRFLRKTGKFAGRALRELHGSGDAWLDGCSPLARTRPAAQERLPGNAGLARALARLGLRVARRGLQKLLYVDQWFIAYRFGDGAGRREDPRQFTRLIPPRDRDWADPFPIERGGRHFIFFEEFVFAAGKAHIAMVEVGRDGACSAPARVLERDYHLSYPFLLEHDGELFMIPETGENRTVELYRCLDFPYRWRLEKVLLRGAWFVDATLHRAADLWWMFVNVGVEDAVADDELHLYHADRLLGEWRPHRGNPVKSDVRCARPAGRLFQRDGVLYRPAQVCAPLYGCGVSINRVQHLSPQAYLEQEEERILPPHPGELLGIHTVNRAGNLSVLDGFMRRPRRGPGTSSLERPLPLDTALSGRSGGAPFSPA
jgi:hypothetical protein